MNRHLTSTFPSGPEFDASETGQYSLRLQTLFLLIVYVIVSLGVDAVSRHYLTPSSIWFWYLPAGISLACMLLAGFPYVVGLFVLTTVHVTWIHSLPIAGTSIVLLGLTVSLGYGAVALVLRRLVQIDVQLRGVRDVAALFVATFLGAGIVSMLGGLILMQAGMFSWSQYPRAVFAWWIGDMLGLLVITPVLLIHGDRWWQAVRRPRVTLKTLRRRFDPITASEFGTYSILIVFTIVFVFQADAPAGRFHRLYLFFIPLIFMGLRYGIGATTLAIPIINVGALLAIGTGQLHLYGSELQIFFLIVATTGLLLSILVPERDHVAATLGESRERLRRLSDLTSGVRVVARRKQIEQALREEEARYRSLYENAPVAYFTADLDARIRMANERALQLLGYDRLEEMRKHGVFELCADTSAGRAKAKALYARVLRGERIRDEEVELQHAEGHSIWVSLSVQPVVDDAGTVIESWTAAVDVTERKQREREQAAIASVASALRTAQSRTDVLPVILDQIHALLNVSGTAVVLHDPTTNTLRVELAWGGWKHLTDARVSGAESLSKLILESGEPYTNSDVRDDPRLALHDLIEVLHSVAGVPLIARGRAIGVLWAARSVEITSTELDVLTAIADIAANAIDQTTVHEQTKRRAQRLAALYDIDRAIASTHDLDVTLNILLDRVLVHLAVDAAAVLLLDAPSETLYHAANRGFRTPHIVRATLSIGEGPAGEAVRERRLIAIPNVRKSKSPLVRSWLATEEEFVTYYALPLMAKGHVKGVLEVFRRESFTPNSDWFAFLHAIGGQAAVAVDNAELLSDLPDSNTELMVAYEATIKGWANTLELRDIETTEHSRRVTAMTLALARRMNMPKRELVHVRRGALLHDIGKLGIPDRILFKPGPLDDSEWQVMCAHPIYAYNTLRRIRFLQPALDIPYYHHERWDGSGYPDGLAGEEIPLAARIFAVADVFDALTSDRPYRDAWTREEALAYIRREAGKHFDPDVVVAFFEIIEEDTVAG